MKNVRSLIVPCTTVARHDPSTVRRGVVGFNIEIRNHWVVLLGRGGNTWVRSDRRVMLQLRGNEYMALLHIRGVFVSMWRGCGCGICSSTTQRWLCLFIWMEALRLIRIESLSLLLTLGLLVEILDVLLQSNHWAMIIKQVLRFVVKIDILSHYLNWSSHSDINRTIHSLNLHLESLCIY